MATQPRNPTEVEYYRKRYDQQDPAPNLTALYALKIAPFFARMAEPDFTSRARPVQDFIWEATTTLGIPAQTAGTALPRAATYVPVYRRGYPQVEQQGSTTVLRLVTAVRPFVPVMFEQVYRRGDRDFLQMETLSYLPGPVIAPYLPVDFPTPMRARATPQDFFFESAGIPPPKPFAQTDWPYPFKLRQTPFGFEVGGITTRGIPAGIALPFAYTDWITPVRARQVPHEIPPNVTIIGPPQPFPFFFTEWPNPLRPKERPGESYSSPHILLITPVLRPFAQTDWPPLAQRKGQTPSADFGWEAWTTLYKPLPPAGALIMPNLIGENIYEAMKLLQQAGIYIPNTAYFNEYSSISVKWAKSTVYPGGVVIGQSVMAGNLTTKGVPLTLTIASFPFASLIDLPPDWKQ